MNTTCLDVSLMSDYCKIKIFIFRYVKEKKHPIYLSLNTMINFQRLIQLWLVLVVFAGTQCFSSRFASFHFVFYAEDNCSKINQTNCEFCGPGKYFNTKIENCTCCKTNGMCDQCPDCEQGFFNNIFNVTKCQPCDKGYFSK
jgi:hypothetical protein